MAQEEEASSDGILQLFPNDQQEPKHEAFRTTTYSDSLPLYQLRREPTHIAEFDCAKDAVIWRDNETLICLNQSSNFEGRHLYFTIEAEDAPQTSCTIYGKTDAAIAETATFYLSLKYYENTESRLHIHIRGADDDYEDDEDDEFDFTAFQPQQLACIFDANPVRHYEFSENIIWSAEQFAILATRPYPLNIKLIWISVKDEGTAFVEALEKRHQPSFGSFIIVSMDKDKVPFSSVNQKRLFNLDITCEKLKIGVLDQESALLPLSVKTDTLVYEVEAAHLRPTDVDVLDIVAKDLKITVYLSDMDNWYDPLLSLLNRIAALGHFERLSFFVEDGMTGFHERDDDDEDRAAEALIKVIKANPKLEYLDISTAHCLDWSVNFEKIFESMEDHKTLRTFILPDLVAPLFYMKDKKFERLCLRHPVNDYLGKLISRNRNITVYDRFGGRCSKVPRIHKIYLLNAFFHGSAELVKDSSPDRPLLAATALVESAAESFQYSALLLSNHTDMLCGLIQDINLDEIVPDDIVLPVPIPTIATKASKRKTKSQLSRAAKKAARS